jgi:ABC-type transport system involved in multi-copper enzyme maturation permease subunit
MTWLAWRQSRAQVAVVAVAIAGAVAVLVGTHGHIATADLDDLGTGYQSLRLLGTGLIGLPAFLGAFWGAPLVARELETGTHRLVWTQGVSRGTWLWTRLGVLALAALALTSVGSLVFTWWSAPFDAAGNRLGTANFGQRGIAPMAYTLFALALGTLLGTVMRRTLPAMAATLAGFFVVRFTFQWVVRAHLLATETVTRPTNQFGPVPGSSATDGAWVLSSHTVDAAGRAVSDREVNDAIAAACHVTRATTSEDLARCAGRLGLQDVVQVHPANHFWALQAMESAAFVGLAVLLAVGSAWWLRHRTS